MPRTGRKPGNSGSREAIVDAARRRFAAQGYEGATIRAIAGDADVDPALVHHYFGSKQRLFAVALELPANPADVIPPLIASEPERAGRRLAHLMLTSWDATVDVSPFIAMTRSMVSDEHVAGMVREFVHSLVLQPVMDALPPPDAELRASLLASQIMGLIVARYILRVEPLASTDIDVVVDAVAPNFQRYLTGAL